MLKLLSKIDFGKVFQIYFSTVLMVDGTDKFFNFITYWPMYLAPQVPQITGFDAQTVMYGIGVVEFAIGVLLWLSARIGGTLASLLMLGIAANLIVAGKFYNIVLIDIALAICAAALVQSAGSDPQEAQYSELP